MTENETKRIAELTVGALNKTMESAKAAMLAAVEAAEEKTREMRQATEEFIADFEKTTSELSHNASTHIQSCQAAIEAFQGHHLKILNGDAQIPAPEPMVNIKVVGPQGEPLDEPTHIDPSLSTREREERVGKMSEYVGKRTPVPPPPPPLAGSHQR